jgi:hypothetical protein
VSQSTAHSDVKIAPFTGGQKLMGGAAAVGVLGLLATAAGFATDAQRMAPAYLVSFLYWTGIAMAGLIMLSIFHAGKGQWMTVLRRQMEHISTFVWVSVVLFVPIYIFRDKLFVWVQFEHGHTPTAYSAARMTEHFQHLMHESGSGKSVWLSSSFFLVRGLLVLGLWSVLAWLHSNWSLKQDTQAPTAEFREKSNTLASVSLLFIGITMTVGAFDWMMSLEPEWSSSTMGVYYFAGSFLACWAVMALATAMPVDRNLPAGRVSSHHLHNLGKFMLAFTAFWAYIAYNQMMIIWHANIPEETPWFFARGLSGLSQFTEGSTHPDALAAQWFPVVLFLVFGHFVLPLILLLPQPFKTNRKFLTAIAFWILFVHFVDLYFVVMPAIRLIDEKFRAPQPGWQDLAAFAGIGGLAVAWVIFRMRGKHAIPVNDPTLAYSLNYVNPL